MFFDVQIFKTFQDFLEEQLFKKLIQFFTVILASMVALTVMGVQSASALSGPLAIVVGGAIAFLGTVAADYIKKSGVCPNGVNMYVHLNSKVVCSR